jgi:hypothetical protein
MKTTSVKLGFLSLLFAGVSALTGCASQPLTMEQRENKFEKPDYTNWVGDEDKQERLSARSKGSLAANLALEYDKVGLEGFNQRLSENGVKVHDIIYFQASMIGNITPVNIIGSLLAATSSGPSFGSSDYEGQFIYHNNLVLLSKNFAVLASEKTINPADLNNGGLTDDHKVHLYSKEALLKERSLIKYLAEQDYDCEYKDIKPEGNYAQAWIKIQPLDTYNEVLYCNKGDNKLSVQTRVFPVKNEDGSYTVRSVAEITGQPSHNHVITSGELHAMILNYYVNDPQWDAMLTSARDIPDLDREVIILSKHQDLPWKEQYAKWSIYPRPKEKN